MENMKAMQSCDACGEGHLHPMISKKAAEYKGTHGQVVIHYSVCDVCKAELVGVTESLKNKREWVRFKKVIDHIPLGAEIVEMRRKHNLSQTLAADIFGGGPVAFSKYENDDLIPDEAMVSLLKLAMAYPDTVRRLAEIKKIELPYQRVLLEVQFEISAGQRIETFAIPKTPQRDTAPIKRSRMLQRPTTGKGVSKSTPKTISQSSGGLVKKISSGGATWTLQ